MVTLEPHGCLGERQPRKQEKQYLLCIPWTAFCTHCQRGKRASQSLVPLEIVDVWKARPAPSWKDQVLRVRKKGSLLSSSLLQDQLEYSHLFVWAVIFQSTAANGPSSFQWLSCAEPWNGPSGLFQLTWKMTMFLPKQLRRQGSHWLLPTWFQEPHSLALRQPWSVSPRAFCKAEHWCDQKEIINQGKTSTPKILNRPAYEDAWNVYHVFRILLN